MGERLTGYGEYTPVTIKSNTGAAPTGPEPSRTGWKPIGDLKHDGDAEDEAVCGFWAGPVLVYVPDALGGVMLVAQCDAGDWLVGDETRCFGDMLKQPTHFMPLPPAPCDEPRDGGDAVAAEGQSPAGAIEFANSEVKAPASQDLKALQAENERLRQRVVSAEKWAATFKDLHAQKVRHLGDEQELSFRLEAQNKSLTTALAESERKRVEGDTVAVPRLCDVEALPAYYAVLDSGQRCQERTIGAINAYVAEAARLASTPTQETPDDQG